MSAETLRDVTSAVRAATATACARARPRPAVGISRVTARRYLEHLAGTGLADRQPSLYSGGGGRPEVEYRWTGA